MSRNYRELNDYRQALSKQLFQFSLRAFVVFVFFLLLLVLLMHELYARFGPVAACVAALAGLSVFAHVAGAAIGNRLRDNHHLGTCAPRLPESPPTLQPIRAQPSDFAPATQLSRHQPLPRRPVVFAVGIGALIGALVASIILTIVMWENLAIGNVAFGSFSAAVIGGLFGFWLSSLFQVAKDAVAEAQRD